MSDDLSTSQRELGLESVGSTDMATRSFAGVCSSTESGGVTDSSEPISSTEESSLSAASSDGTDNIPTVDRASYLFGTLGSRHVSSESCKHRCLVLREDGRLTCTACSVMNQLFCPAQRWAQSSVLTLRPPMAPCNFHRAAGCRLFQVGFDCPPFGVVVLYEFRYRGVDSRIPPYDYVSAMFCRMMEFFMGTICRTEKGAVIIPPVRLFYFQPTASTEAGRSMIHFACMPLIRQLTDFWRYTIDGHLLDCSSRTFSRSSFRNWSPGFYPTFCTSLARTKRNEASMVSYYDPTYTTKPADADFSYQRRIAVEVRRVSLFHCDSQAVAHSGPFTACEETGLSGGGGKAI